MISLILVRLHLLLQVDFDMRRTQEGEAIRIQVLTINPTSPFTEPLVCTVLEAPHGYMGDIPFIIMLSALPLTTSTRTEDLPNALACSRPSHVTATMGSGERSGSRSGSAEQAQAQAQASA